RIDDLVAVDAAAAALELVLGAERQLGDALWLGRHRAILVPPGQSAQDLTNRAFFAWASRLSNVEGGVRGAGRLATVARRLLWASLALVPATILADFVLHAGKVLLFVLAALALVPLAWLIGDATEHAAAHTGARIGG